LIWETYSSEKEDVMKKLLFVLLLGLAASLAGVAASWQRLPESTLGKQTTNGLRHLQGPFCHPRGFNVAKSKSENCTRSSKPLEKRIEWRI
jgi:hypothetical protein